MSQELTIGTIFSLRNKRKDLCTVIDILKTYNSSGELVRTRYVCQHVFMGQTVTHEECAVTILRGKE